MHHSELAEIVVMYGELLFWKTGNFVLARLVGNLRCIPTERTGFPVYTRVPLEVRSKMGSSPSPTLPSPSSAG
jgi:hypothetical protein